VTAVIPARIRIFSDATIRVVTGLSRTTRWRRRQRGNMGADVVRFMQQQRTEAGLPALDEKDILDALVAVEDARLAERAENTVNQKAA